MPTTPAGTSPLESRAAAIRGTIEQFFFDRRGWLIERVNQHTMKPYGRGELPEEAAGYTDDDPNPATAAERATYEDTMFCTGLYLWALTEQHRVERTPTAKAIADRVFDDLQPLLGENDRIEKGYIGKPWGGRPRRRTTLDQTFYFTFGLHRYTEIADDTRKRRAAEIIAANVDWWMGRDYHDLQFPDEEVSGWLSPAFGGCMMAEVFLAYLHTGDRRYLDERHRLEREYKADWFPIHRLHRWLPVDASGRKTRLIAMWHHAIPLALWTLAKGDPGRLPHWQERFVDHWHKELKLGLRTDGLTDVCVRLNLADGTEEPIQPDERRYVTEMPGQEELVSRNLKLQLWLCAARSSYFSAHTAVSSALMAETVPWMADEARRVLRCVLGQLDVADFTEFFDPDGLQWPPERKHNLHTLTVFGMTAWLIAYWQGRRLGLIP